MTEREHILEGMSIDELFIFAMQGGTLPPHLQRKLDREGGHAYSHGFRPVPCSDTVPEYPLATSSRPILPRVSSSPHPLPILCTRPKLRFRSQKEAAAWLAGQHGLSPNYAEVALSRSLRNSHGLPVKVLGYQFAHAPSPTLALSPSCVPLRRSA